MSYDIKKLHELEESLNSLNSTLIKLENGEFSSQYIVDLMMAAVTEAIDRYNYELHNTGFFTQQQLEVINNTIIDGMLKRIKFHVDFYNGGSIN